MYAEMPLQTGCGSYKRSILWALRAALAYPKRLEIQ